MAETMIVNEGQAITRQPAKPQAAKPRQFRELMLKVELSAKIKLNIVSTLDTAEIQEGLRNGTVVPDWKRQILSSEGNQIGTFTIPEARVKEVL
jgi:hypothetical protein